MRDLNDKITGGNLTADEWNDVPSELQGVIEDMGQVLSGADLDQLGKAIAGMAGAASFYSESGIADAYVCDVVGAKQGPQALNAVHDGLIVRFRPGNANTGASTINVNGLGVKDLEREDGTALVSGDLATTRDAYCRYDSGTDDFFVLNFSLTGPADILHSGAKAKRTTDVTVSSSSTLEIIMTAEVYDDGAWFAASSTDFVVPTGVTRIMFVGNVEIDDQASSENRLSLEVFKNGASFDGGARCKWNSGGNGNDMFGNVMLIDNCVPTDTYSLALVNTDTSTKNINGTGNHVWMAITALQKS